MGSFLVSVRILPSGRVCSNAVHQLTVIYYYSIKVDEVWISGQVRHFPVRVLVNGTLHFSKVMSELRSHTSSRLHHHHQTKVVQDGSLIHSFCSQFLIGCTIGKGLQEVEHHVVVAFMWPTRVQAMIG